MRQLNGLPWILKDLVSRRLGSNRALKKLRDFVEDDVRSRYEDAHLSERQLHGG